MRISRTLLAIVAACALAGCAQYATVSKKKPSFHPVKAAVGAFVSVEQGIAKTLRHERREPLVAIGEWLTAARASQEALARHPEEAGARDAYNFAVARVLGTVQAAKLDPWTRPLRAPAAGGEFLLTHAYDPRPGWNPAEYEFTPADQFEVKGDYVTEHERKEGIGAPVVAIAKERNANAVRDFAIPRTYYGVTALLRFEGRRARIVFEDPLATERVSLGGRSFPLAADFTAPLAVMLASANVKQIELASLLRPERYAENARIVRLEPYDPRKTVVLVIHGLKDSPATWTPMINRLRADAGIRQRYQFWFYSYPSGYPYPYSAAILRRELDAIERRFPLRGRMVVIGHSMGGCIGRLLLTDSGDRMWTDFFGQPPGATALSAKSKALLTETLIFKPRPEVGRAIFISAPLRGSELASGWVGRLASRLVRTPAALLEVGRDVLKIATFQPDDPHLQRIPTSVDTLSPSNRFVQAIQTYPFAPGVPYHVICGDRGVGGHRDHTKPQMSDGVVPYWSSHLDGAQSEAIVPSHHNAHQHPLAIAEVARILKLHARR